MNEDRASGFDETGPDGENLHGLLGAFVISMRQLAEKRRAAGRFNLEEAAVAVVHRVATPDNVGVVRLHWERDWPLLSKLIQSARTGELHIYSPEGLQILPDEAQTVQWFARETYWKDLNAWLDKNEPNVLFRFPPPADSIATAVLGCAEASTEQDKYPDDSDLGLGKRERQIRRIEWAAKQLGFAPTAVPDGGKVKLMAFCRKEFPMLLLSEDSFNGAWKAAGGQKDGRVRLRLANHDKYTNRCR